MIEKITPYPEQLKMASEAIPILKEHGMVYLASEERTGKTLTAILIAEDTIARRVLVLTKKKALEGWEDMLNGYTHITAFEVTTYGKAHYFKNSDYDLIILDEAHNYISGFPKPSSTWKKVKTVVGNLPVIYMSATPYAQGTQLLFHQLKLCVFSPFAKFKTFYDWYKKYAKLDKAGNFQVTYIGPSRTAIDYKALRHDDVKAAVNHLFLTKTRKELGFKHEPDDVIHHVELSDSTKQAYNTLLKDNVLDFTHADTKRDYSIVCDSGIKLRWTLHMLEGGVLKHIEIVDKKEKPIYIVLKNREKIDYILDKWGDTEDLVIMYQYKAELIKLREVFKKAWILQATSFSEGVDLSKFEHLVIYSQDFSTARHTQRRARQANKERKTPIKVHFLLVKKAISEQVYKVCSVNKKNFIDSLFEREEL